MRQLYGIVQGGVYPDLRKEAVDFVNTAPFFGIAVGGSLGADKVQYRCAVCSVSVVCVLARCFRGSLPSLSLSRGGFVCIFLCALRFQSRFCFISLPVLAPRYTVCMFSLVRARV